MTDEPSHSVEIELKFDVDDATPLPDFSDLPGVASVAAPEPRDLDARYLDTADLALGRAGYALRRRTGGPDEGWHIKGPRRADGGRVELHWPLGSGVDDVPTAALDALSSVSIEPLHPLARIENLRVATELCDADGGVVAEFVDDRVTALDERSGTVSHWREWEFELGPAAPVDDAARAALLTAATDAVTAAGGRVAASDSKLARTLGL
ncbi:CYTH domain-containing protein [Microbacterium fluvii]|uniref:CYTH domain-containing protein n=1 Tax=Microbacterium fluvii TaxID=415215 RepID=A0ABW2HKC3_9MICO|nr:CYTH domain-containing protein [Microbacterium fluvii]MCU4673611.1 CYTH domain-containing protein [Microbacterium fluvii]